MGPGENCHGRARKRLRRREPIPVGFPLLDLLAMLANMEAESLRRILNEEAPGTLAAGEDTGRTERFCPYSVARRPATAHPAEIACTGVREVVHRHHRHALRGLRRASAPLVLPHSPDVRSQAACSNDVLRRQYGPRSGGDPLPVCRRVAEAVRQQGLGGGEGRLAQVIAVRDKELTQRLRGAADHRVRGAYH